MNTLLGLSYVPLIVGFVLTAHNYRKVRHIHLLFASITLSSVLIWFTFDFLAFVLQNPLLIRYSIYAFLAMGLSFVLQFEVIAHEHISPLPVFIIGCLSVSVIILSLEPNAIIVESLPNHTK